MSHHFMWHVGFLKQSSDGVSLIEGAANASSRCCILVAPTIGAVITVFDKSHARAICARETPRSAAKRATWSTTFLSASAAFA
jgi:hypothetical protein